MVVDRANTTAEWTEGKAASLGIVRVIIVLPSIIKGLEVSKISFNISADIQARKLAIIAWATCSFLIFPSINQRITSPIYKNQTKKLAKKPIINLCINTPFPSILEVTNNMHLLKAFKYAFTGILEAFRSEKNMRVHLCLGILAIIFGFIFNLSTIEWAILTLTIGFVFSMEFINTSIEKIVDIVSPEKQEKARIAKDLGAAAVLISAIISIIVAIFLFFTKLFR